MELWDSLSATSQTIVQMGALATALTAVFMVSKSVVNWIRGRYQSLEWVFTDQHDHKVIMESLGDISDQLKRNGGTSIKDSLDRIEFHQDFQSAYMRTTLQANSKAIFETDMDGEITFVNNSFCRLMAVSAHELMGSGWVNVINPKDRDRIIGKWKSAVEAHRNFDDLIPYVDGNGKSFQAHAMAYIICSSENEPLGYIGEVIPLDS